MSRIVFLFMLTCLSAYALEWQEYEQARELQKKNHKIIMIEAMRSSCHYCQDMEENTFDDPEMSKWIEERFISVKINLGNDFMPLNISPGMTPSFYFINEKEELIKKIPGSWNIEDFKELTKGIK